MKPGNDLRHYGVKGMKWRQHKQLTAQEKLRLEREAGSDMTTYIKEVGNAEQVYDDIIDMNSPEEMKKGVAIYRKYSVKPQLESMRRRKMAPATIRKMAEKLNHEIAKDVYRETRKYKVATEAKAKIVAQKQRRYGL